MPGTKRAVFLSYRRAETRHIAGRLADRLGERLGSTRVFMDVDTIEPGADVRAAIARAVASCDVLIALIGPTWSTIADQQGRRRLDDPDDFVVLEIRAALERQIQVIPVLVDGAVMPDRQGLPEGLQSLAGRNAVRLDHVTFRSDVARLLEAVDRILPSRARKSNVNDLGIQLAKKGNIAGARAAFQRAIDSGDPESAPMAAVHLGSLLAEQNDVVGAWSAYQVAIDSGHRESTAKAGVNLGVLLAEQNDVAGARAAYQVAIDSGHTESTAKATVNLGVLLVKLGDVAGARAAFQRANG
jgi:tetratricopeptide (TPR) repeat protein